MGKSGLPLVRSKRNTITLLRGLRHCIDADATMLHRYQNGWRRKIAIPDIVMYALKMPECACLYLHRAQASVSA